MFTNQRSAATGSRTVGFAFLTIDEQAAEGDVNFLQVLEYRLAQCFKRRRFSHVEAIDVDLNYGTGAAISIVQGRKVHEGHKQFSREEYMFIKVEMSAPQYERFFQFLRSKVDVVGFGWFSMRWNNTLGALLDCYYDAQGGSYFCSELIAAALVHAGYLSGNVRPCSVDPDLLYELITAKGSKPIQTTRACVASTQSTVPASALSKFGSRAAAAASAAPVARPPPPLLLAPRNGNHYANHWHYGDDDGDDDEEQEQRSSGSSLALDMRPLLQRKSGLL
jgi:hypothetical protein